MDVQLEFDSRYLIRVIVAKHGAHRLLDIVGRVNDVNNVHRKFPEDLAQQQLDAINHCADLIRQTENEWMRRNS